MHVQLLNESAYNREHKLRIHSLCFYYRNHKHVLYGSFTINDELFIFSFNIFDIYRSYTSKSNKKTSKTTTAPSAASSSKVQSSSQASKASKAAAAAAQQQKQIVSVVINTTSATVPSAATTTTAPTVAPNTTSSVVAPTDEPQPQSEQAVNNLADSEVSTANPIVSTTNLAPIVNKPGVVEVPQAVVAAIPPPAPQQAPQQQQQQLQGPTAQQIGDGLMSDFSKYINNIIKLENAAAAVQQQQQQHQQQHIHATLNMDANNSKPSSAVIPSNTAAAAAAAAAAGNVNSNYFENMFSMINNDLLAKQQQMANATANMVNTAAANRQPYGGQANISSNSKQIDSNLSNFLNVRFEVCVPSQQQQLQQQSASSQQVLQQQVSTSSNDLPASAAALKSSTPPATTTSSNPNSTANLQSQPQATASASSASKKYKKSIKILSVSCKRLNPSNDPSQTGDISLKNYEFTEKCLSFRLASIDLNQSISSLSGSKSSDINGNCFFNFDFKYL